MRKVEIKIDEFLSMDFAEVMMILKYYDIDRRKGADAKGVYISAGKVLFAIAGIEQQFGIDNAVKIKLEDTHSIGDDIMTSIKTDREMEVIFINHKTVGWD